MIRIGNFMVSNIDISHFLKNQHIKDLDKGKYDGIPGKLKMINPFINALVEEPDIGFELDLELNESPNMNHINDDNNNNNQTDNKNYNKTNHTNKNKDNTNNNNNNKRKKNNNPTIQRAVLVNN